MGLYLILIPVYGQKVGKLPSPVSPGKEGKLSYAPDSLGNRIVDFSHSGYMGANAAIPDVPVKVFVPAKEGDATLRIQSALDHVSSLPLDSRGFRGAVLLGKGTHHILGGLSIISSGVVLRGSGKDETILLAEGKTRETVVRIFGKNDKKVETSFKIEDRYVPVNANVLHILSAKMLSVGDKIQIVRPSTGEWIKTLRMEEFGGETGWLGWKPGQRDIVWDRTIKSIENEYVTIDVPIATALEQRYGGGTLARYNWPGRISQVGVENLRIVSAFDEANPKDEDHRWMGITLENVENAWVRQIEFLHLAGSAVAVYETASKITVEDCKSLQPVSEIGGQRRYSFFTQGQQTLFQRCFSENGYHDFSVGFCAAGPNAFVQCEAKTPFSFSGAIDSWASGTLFDIVNIDGHALSFKNRGQGGQGAGWTAANSVFWQCSASMVENFSPPTAQNYAFGIWAQFAGDGYWEHANEHIQPASLYYAQLADRLGRQVFDKTFLLPRETEASSSPSIEQASQLALASHNPVVQLSEWIDRAGQRNHIPVDVAGVKSIDEIGVKQVAQVKPVAHLAIENGWLVRSGHVITGDRQEVAWWRGGVRPFDQATAKPHITRFVPGRTGTGFTDDPEEMTEALKAQNVAVLDHNYGLWYDRRRDDHERIRRIDGEVWPPFYEQPFARSGQGKAWDDLSKYDLTKYNNWYWDRLRQFAGLADQKGLVLYHQNYFQHNILEAGAHYADFPWRPANNINDTGFPEPPPYAGDKRIFMADQFYDITHPTRKQLHRAYIRQCLDNFKDTGSVVQFISAEYTGPLHFVQFWLDVIDEWEREKSTNALVALSTTKDVQDAILSEPHYSKIVDMIDIRYWNNRADGTSYAPEGGKNLAPRQHARIQKTGKISFGSVYASVLEYRQKYPDKPVLYSSTGYDSNGWAVFMAGGSLAAIPQVSHSRFVADAAKTKPAMLSDHTDNQYVLLDPGKSLIMYVQGNGAADLDLTGFSGNFVLRKIDVKTGQIAGKETKVKGGKVITIKPEISGQPVVLWVSAK